ncbi:MAG TPA: hypothetical protein PKC43_13420 [Phycisphaerales bacterium]|nr:hypothetical protein [Phycisphaerales bacterium]HMP38432.1 hypothetical protein [Phycisphaerales bacterium]
MHERRNFVLVIALIVLAIWTIYAWTWLGETLGTATAGEWTQRMLSTLGAAVVGAWLAWALLAEDRLPDHLLSTGGVYYEMEGLCFVPVVRAGKGDVAELSIYYQNRFENPVNAVVHLRPPLDSFHIKPGMRDVHFAFRAGGGDYGCIRQPIAVPGYLQGEVVDVELAAASYYPRGQGSRVRRREGIPCGSLSIDWQGAAFKTGVHEVSGEVELVRPTVLHLAMPRGVKARLDHEPHWRQESLAAGIGR